MDFLRAAWLELVKSLAVSCQPPGSQVVVVVVRSTLFLAMHLLFLCSKGNRLAGCEAITHNYSVIVQRLLCIAQVFFRFCFRILRSEINVLCGDQRRVGQSEKPAALQCKAARQVGELFADDVVVSEFFYKAQRL